MPSSIFKKPLKMSVMSNVYNTALAACGIAILLLLWKIDVKEDQIQSLKTAQTVAENNALQQQRKTEQEWQTKLENVTDEHQTSLQDLERRYNDAVHSLDSLQQSAGNNNGSALPSSTATSCNVKQSANSGRNTASLRACEKSVLEFAKERDECAVKYNTLLKLYQQVSK